MKTYIKEEREKRKIMQKNLADKLNVAASTLATYENTERDPPLELLCNVADLFDISLDLLIRGKEKDRPFGRSKEEMLKQFDSMPEEEISLYIHLLQTALADKQLQAFLRQKNQA